MNKLLLHGEAHLDQHHHIAANSSLRWPCARCRLSYTWPEAHLGMYMSLYEARC